MNSNELSIKNAIEAGASPEEAKKLASLYGSVAFLFVSPLATSIKNPDTIKEVGESDEDIARRNGYLKPVGLREVWINKGWK